MKRVNIENKTILVTGAAGFIGAALIMRLFDECPDCHVIGIDNMNDYYDVRLKEYRLEEIRKKYPSFKFVRGSISDSVTVKDIFREYMPSVVVNLAAQAGVRNSIDRPDDYINSNIIGFYNILEACRYAYADNSSGVEHLVYASSSSVYGGSTKVPFSVDDPVNSPVSLYAATKKSNELMAYAYSKLYNIPCTGLRFFTVYGPAGRPDMAYFKFTETLKKGGKIEIYNYGNCERDFTYIDDIVEGILRVIKGAPEKKTGEDGLPLAPYALYNIGNSRPENLLTFIDILQEELIRAGVLSKDFNLDDHKVLVPMQAGDVAVTYADISALQRDFAFCPQTDIRTGLRKFAQWYAEYYGAIYK